MVAPYSSEAFGPSNWLLCHLQHGLIPVKNILLPIKMVRKTLFRTIAIDFKTIIKKYRKQKRSMVIGKREQAQLPIQQRQLRIYSTVRGSINGKLLRGDIDDRGILTKLTYQNSC